jgi:hypothetical protein
VIPAGKPLPYGNGSIIDVHLVRKLEPEQLGTALRVMLSHAASAVLEVPVPSDS